MNTHRTGPLSPVQLRQLSSAVQVQQVDLPGRRLGRHRRASQLSDKIVKARVTVIGGMADVKSRKMAHLYACELDLLLSKRGRETMSRPLALPAAVQQHRRNGARPWRPPHSAMA